MLSPLSSSSSSSSPANEDGDEELEIRGVTIKLFHAVLRYILETYPDKDKEYWSISRVCFSIIGNHEIFYPKRQFLSSLSIWASSSSDNNNNSSSSSQSIVSATTATASSLAASWEILTKESNAKNPDLLRHKLQEFGLSNPS